jgi:hypothetical protein
MNKDNKVWLTERELAERWRKSTRTLMNYRAQGKAPQYAKVGGKILYDLEVIQKQEQQSVVDPIK